jgi:hypothetical protein
MCVDLEATAVLLVYIIKRCAGRIARSRVPLRIHWRQAVFLLVDHLRLGSVDDRRLLIYNTRLGDLLIH